MRTLLLLIVIALAACSKPAENERKIKMYQSPMHPWITSDKPGNCTICGMALVPVYEDQQAAPASGVVQLGEGSIKALRVATAPVELRPLTRALRFTGILEDDENFHRVIAAFYDGRIDQVFVNHVGTYVEKGQPLAAIYSPELLYIVREFQAAGRNRNEAAYKNAAQRLVQYGLSPEQVKDLSTQPDSSYTIQLLAPISGTVLTKTAYQGQYIKTGEPLFEMGVLNRLWFHAEVYERDLPSVKLGQKAIIRTPTVPGREFPGVVTFIDPNFDPQTRSTKVRIEVDNPLAEEGGLRRLLPHKAYAEATIFADLGEVLVAPASSVLQDGRRSVVYVEEQPGVYAMRPVTAGRRGEEGIEILSGLEPGMRVVTEGNLMIDAEAQLRHPQSAIVLASPDEGSPTAIFLQALAKVSDRLAADDAAGAVAAAGDLPSLAEKTGDAELHGLAPIGGGTIEVVRQSFLPWSEAGARLALAKPAAGLEVFQCPMSGDSFPDAPAKARWVQAGHDVRNPFFGAKMLSCGAPASHE